MSANGLKIIALISMTIDHIGMMLFPSLAWMRVIGRIAFPVFAFMIAESCRYTRNRRNYLLRMALMGIGMQVVFFFATGSLYQSVFISFTLAILLICLLDKAGKERRIRYWLCAAGAVLAVVFLCAGLPEILYKTDYSIDYGIVGILLPVVCYFIQNRPLRIGCFALGLVALSLSYGGLQWFCLLAVPLLALYNYQRGRLNMKSFFYFYYPAHLCILFVVSVILNH